MMLISHRGNINGINPTQENSPSYIMTALNKKYSVEVDVWYDKGWWFGHDEPTYKVDVELIHLLSIAVIFHAKNAYALKYLLKYKTHVFWHQSDDYTLTSQGFIWVYPNKKLVPLSICCLPELGCNGNLAKCIGICSDFVEKYNYYII